MTFVPDNAGLCDCWAKASEEERVASGRRNRPGPRGLASCERCHGVGFWVPNRASAASLKQPEGYDSPELVRVVTVGELRAALADLPADAPLFVDGYEGGLDRPYLREIRLRNLKPYEDSGGSYTGPWSEVRPGSPEGTGMVAWLLHRQQ